MPNTKEQQKAIDTEGGNIIVSAGAGSGKTAVLTQRVIRKIKDGINVNQILVLTFTNEAASEMKSRIREAIIKNRLDEQLVLLDSSYITTFDSFALSMVKKYAYTLNLTANISIVDSNIITIYKYKVLDKIFDSLYEEDNFKDLVGAFCGKDDDNLKKEIINLSEKLDLLVDKDKFISEYQTKYMSDEFILNKYLEYEKLIKKKIDELQEIYQDFTSYINDQLINKLDSYFKVLFEGNTYQEYKLFDSLPSVRMTAVSEEGLSLKDDLKENIKEIKRLLRFKDKEEIINSIKNTYQHILVILDIIKKLDSEVFTYKQEKEVYEFNDIAHMAIKIVKDNPEIREEIKNYFNEIMVDEYQDTSSIQETFVNLISNNNVYMVGDVKQSIYRFRNANPYIFQEKYNQYSQGIGGTKIDLLKNFRSRSETLYNINEIFNLIMDDEIGNAEYLKDHNMVYGNTAYDEEHIDVNNYLEIYNYDDEINLDFDDFEKQLFIVSEDINNKIQQGYQVFDKKSGKLRKIKYSDICIITDRNKYLEKYKKILEYKGIPSILYMNMALTNNKVILVIKNLISLVNHVNNKIFDDKFKYLFTSVARSFIFEYSDDLIYKIISEKKFFDTEIINLARDINMFQPLVKVINDIINKFKIYDKLTNLYNINDDLVRINNLLNIADSLNDLGYGTEEFVSYLDEVIEKDLSVEYSINTSDADAVKIMNIHKSKGLEFSICYFVGLENKFTIKELNEKFLFNQREGIILPYYEDDELKDTILKDIYRNNFYLEEISEKIRLFYVALTRCREKMIMVCSLKELDGYDKLVPSSKRIKYRSFLDILKSLSVIDKYLVPKEAEYTKDYDEVVIKDLEEFKNDKLIEKKTIDIEYKLMGEKHFSKSSYALADISSIKAMEYGTLMHERLEYANLDDLDNKIIKHLFEKVAKDYINVYREYEFKYTDMDNIYHGIIDLMLEYQDYINIIDYKLKNIDDSEYINQLNGYKKYIEDISQKKVFIYLYSIMDDELKKL